MSTEPEEAVDGQVVDEGPEPELAGVVDTLLPEKMTVDDPGDFHETMIVLDNHDVDMMLREMESVALRRWVYDADGKLGLTVHCVQDVVQRMNWTGKCGIGLLPETLHVEQIQADEGHGPEPFWVATIFAIDEKTGQRQSGTSMEPQRMRLRHATAEKYRIKGQKIPEDDTIFDRHARTKAINKAERNAQAKFIPEIIEQSIIAKFKSDPSRVEKIQTTDEAKLSEMPPPLTDEKATEQIAETRRLYDQIRELGAGQGAVKMPAGVYSSWLLQSQHSHDGLDRMIDYLKLRLDEIPVELQREALEREAVATVNQIACPNCAAEPRKFCKGIKGAHRERLQARYAQLEGA